MRKLAFWCLLCCLCTAVQLNPRPVAAQSLDGRQAVASVNQFLINSRGPCAPPLQTLNLSRAVLRCALVTPLNSDFNHAGDAVVVKVVSSAPPDRLKPACGQDLLLEGCVESVERAGRRRQPARMVVRFYQIETALTSADVFAAPGSNRGVIGPQPKSKAVTCKQVLRAVLMSASRIAIPAAIGTGGISIAITAGAGAVIGGLLSERGKHAKGVLTGAWQGAGLDILDPVVERGPSVVLGRGTLIDLQIEGDCRLRVVQQRYGKPDNQIFLRTHARLLTRPDCDTAVARARELVCQGDVAQALDVLDKAAGDSATSDEVSKLREALLKYARGETPKPDNP